MHAIQKTNLIISIDEKCVKLVKKLKGEVLYYTPKEINDAEIRCNIPTVDDFISCTKYNSLDWNTTKNL